MSFVRFAWRAVALFCWVCLGLLILSLIFPCISIQKRQNIIQWWSSVLLCFCGVKVDFQGKITQDQSVLFVANHISWLDIFVLDLGRATAFVAKSDIRQWPIIGALVAGAGTVFIDRSQRSAIRNVAVQMQTRFQQNQAVGLFPEGTTSEGFGVARFYASLFETAISAGVDIQPVALRYYDHDQRSARVAFTGEQTLVANIWVLLSQPGVRVECEYLPLMHHTENQQQGRMATSRQAHQAILEAVLKGL